MPPEIRITSPAAGDTLVISSTTAFAYVTAEDPDDDTLLCKWFVDGYEDLGSGKPIIDEDLPGCYINVNNDPLYDGRTLRCIIYDAAFDSDEITWPIDVLQEGT